MELLGFRQVRDVAALDVAQSLFLLVQRFLGFFQFTAQEVGCTIRLLFTDLEILVDEHRRELICNLGCSRRVLVLEGNSECTLLSAALVNYLDINQLLHAGNNVLSAHAGLEFWIELHAVDQFSKPSLRHHLLLNRG